MDLNDVLRVLWQRKLIMVATTLVVLALGFASLQIQTPVYEATSTVALTPGTGTTDPIFIISQIDVITPLYAEAVKTRDTQLLAKSLQKGRDVGELTVRTFSGAPIIKIDVRSPSPAAARSGAQAVTDALLLRAQRGEIGLTDTLALSQIDRPSLPTDPVKPLPKLTMLISLVLGLGSGVAAAVLWDRLGRKIDTIDELAAAAGVPCFGEVPTERAISGLRSPNELVNDPQYRIVAEALARHPHQPAVHQRHVPFDPGDEPRGPPRQDVPRVRARRHPRPFGRPHPAGRRRPAPRPGRRDVGDPPRARGDGRAPGPTAGREPAEDGPRRAAAPPGRPHRGRPR